MTVKTAKIAQSDSPAKIGYILGGEHTARTVKLIRAAAATNNTVMLWGAPGVGKTALVEALANQEGVAGMVRVLTGTQDRSDTLGMPSRSVFTDDEGREYPTTVYSTPEWALTANNAKGGDFFVFLDELAQAEPDVQGTFLTILQSRVMPSGMKFGDHVKFVAAGNPTDLVASGYELIEPLQNRLVHLTYEPPASEWFEGMIAAWGKDVSDEEATLRRYIVGYLVGHRDRLHQPTAAGSTENAWPSRRSWDNLARMGAMLMDDKDTLEAAATGLVGKAAASDFVTSVFRIAVKSPEEIVADPSCVDWSHSFQGFVGLSSVVSWLSDTKDVEAVIAVFNHAVKNGPRDVAATWIKPLIVRIREIGGDKLAVKKLDMTEAGFRDFLPMIYSTLK